MGASYSLIDSWRALSGVTSNVTAIYLTTMLPALVMLVVLSWYLNIMAPPIVVVAGEIESYQLNASYWIWAPLGLALVFFMQTMFVTASSICFYMRTGWRPGAERVDA